MIIRPFPLVRGLVKATFCTALTLWQVALLAQERPPFEEWLATLRAEVVALGISEQSIELAFSEITPPVQRIIQNDRSQPEAVETYADYIGARVSDWRIENGRERMATHGELLREVGESYGVQPRFLVAIWGMETNFGTYPLREPLFNVLATLAYDNRRAEMFRAQFIAAIRLLDSGFPPYEQLKSSWAGALGQTQFMPDSYHRFAVDHDGDGDKDIWNTEADVFASMANYLAINGWRDDLTWGRAVQLPPGGEALLNDESDNVLDPPGSCRSYSSLGTWRDLQEWQALGVRRSDGGDLPTRSIPAALVMGDPDDDQAYVVYQNFCGIMRYNPALKYALAIGLLSDAVAGE